MCLFAKGMLRKCKKLFSLPFSRTRNTAFSRERENVSPNMENTRKHPFTLIIFVIRSRLFSANTDKCKPGLRALEEYGIFLSSLCEREGFSGPKKQNRHHLFKIGIFRVLRDRESTAAFQFGILPFSPSTKEGMFLFSKIKRSAWVGARCWRRTGTRKKLWKNRD